MTEINLYRNCFHFIRLFADFLSVFLSLMRLVLDNSFSFCSNSISISIAIANSICSIMLNKLSFSSCLFYLKIRCAAHVNFFHTSSLL